MVLEARVLQGDTVYVHEAGHISVARVLQSVGARAYIQWLEKDPRCGRPILCYAWIDQPEPAIH